VEGLILSIFYTSFPHPIQKLNFIEYLKTLIDLTPPSANHLSCNPGTLD